MRKLTQEHKDKISAAQKTRVRTEEEKKKISESLKGHEVSEETKILEIYLILQKD